ncbi:MAG: hypothetical protein A2W99_03415 [Bacteroidetes bacterium GWF2_33_16]|nr:MAG: hypothetical protein A2X00_11655 [Bacteroidetes bacterium GWE2_32_14]OFY08235.1 MAG: hypothetical protein A2W99_03415 [Bacteroidetes bacterium GWF2_33_16]
MKTIKKISIITNVLLILIIKGNVTAQNWKECTGTNWNYDLSKVRIITIVFDGFNYEEAVEISGYWKNWGAKVDIAGTKLEQQGERSDPNSKTGHDMLPVTLKTDLLIDKVDFKKYDLIYFSGGEGVEGFLKDNREKLQLIIDEAINNKKYIAAICHGPYILSASKLLTGRQITVQGNNYRAELIKSGAKIVSETFIHDGPFLTGQWPYFETFAVSIAEELAFPNGNGPLAKFKENNNPKLMQIIDQRNVMIMNPGIIADDTIAQIIKHSVNSVLPFEMMNNSYIRFIAIKSPEVKTALINILVKSAVEKYKENNIPAESLKRWYTMVFNAPVIVFVYNDNSEVESIKNPQDKESQLKINTVLAGQAISQLGNVANEFGYSTSIISGLRTLFGEEGFREVLNLSSSYQLCGIVGIGHPMEKMNPAVSRPVNEYLQIK